MSKNTLALLMMLSFFLMYLSSGNLKAVANGAGILILCTCAVITVFNKAR